MRLGYSGFEVVGDLWYCGTHEFGVSRFQGLGFKG